MSLLEGVRVIDFTTYAAGSACGRVLADWKADVIKVEPVTGDMFRDWGRLLGAPVKDDENPMWEINNANKRGLTLDLKTTEGQVIMARLLEDADIFLTNYREKALVKLNLDYEKLSEKYPRLIYGFLDGYGSKGELAEQPGFDLISFWARGGFGGFFGDPDSPPLTPLPAIGDQITGTYLVSGLIAALIGRDLNDKGEKVEISLYHAAIWSAGLFNATSNYWENPKKTRKVPDTPLINMFKASDEKWFCTSIMEHERFWPGFCECIGRPDLIYNERYSQLRNARGHSEELTAILDEAFAKKTREEWMILFKKFDIPSGPIFNGHDVLKDNQALVNDYLRPVTFQNGNTVPLPTPPCHFVNEGFLKWEHAPQIGEHSSEILSEIGYSEEEIASFKSNSII